MPSHTESDSARLSSSTRVSTLNSAILGNGLKHTLWHGLLLSTLSCNPDQLAERGLACEARFDTTLL